MQDTLLHAGVAALAIAALCGIGVWLVSLGIAYDAFMLCVGLAVPIVLYLAGIR
jgi:hypothetical protein